MSSRREVLIKILALLQMKTLLKTKKSHIEMFKTALFDGAINEKCRVFGGGGGVRGNLCFRFHWNKGHCCAAYASDSVVEEKSCNRAKYPIIAELFPIP